MSSFSRRGVISALAAARVGAPRPAEGRGVRRVQGSRWCLVACPRPHLLFPRGFPGEPSGSRLGPTLPGSCRVTDAWATPCRSGGRRRALSRSADCRATRRGARWSWTATRSSAGLGCHTGGSIPAVRDPDVGISSRAAAMTAPCFSTAEPQGNAPGVWLPRAEPHHRRQRGRRTRLPRAAAGRPAPRQTGAHPRPARDQAAGRAGAAGESRRAPADRAAGRTAGQGGERRRGGGAAGPTLAPGVVARATLGTLAARAEDRNPG